MSAARAGSIALIALACGTPAAAQSTGFPACDKYFSMVTACINTKMPAEDRDTQRQQLDVFRQILQSPLGATAAARCEENIKIEIQRDKWGCYGANAAAAGARTPCSLLEPGELGVMLGTSFAPGQPANYACEYASPPTPDRAVRVEVKWTDGAGEMQRWRESVSGTGRLANGQPIAIGADTIAGLADDAFYFVPGITPMIVARKGEATVYVRAHGATRDQMIAVVRRAMSRIP